MKPAQRKQDVVNAPSRTVGSLAIVLILFSAWASSGIAPLRDAVAGALAPGDFATDFVPAATIGRTRSSAGAFPMGIAEGNTEAARLGAPPYANVGVPFGAHPPPAVLLVALLVPLGFSGAALAWLILSLAALAFVAWVAARALAVRDTRRAGIARATTLFAALTIWPPVLHNIEKGQWSLIVAGLLAASWWAFTQRRERLAGALIAVAGAFKIMPLVVLVAFAGTAQPRRRKILIGAAGAFGVAVTLSAAILGRNAWFAFLRSAPINASGWQTGPANTLSIWGALARLLVGGPFARPALTAAWSPWAARVAWGLIAVALIAAALRLTLGKNGRDREPYEDQGVTARSFAAWCALAVLLGPLSWSHAAISLALPLALLRGATASETLPAAFHPLARASLGPIALRLPLGAALVALTIPRMTLFACAGPVPVSPWRGLILSTHMAAALAIFCVATVEFGGRQVRRP